MKIKSIIFLFFLFFNTLHSTEWLAELRGGYFYPTSKKFRKIYEHGGLEGEVEISKSFIENWLVWGNINYFKKNGRSIGLHDKTNIRIIPLSLGLKYPFLFCSPITPYLGAGVAYTFTHIKNDSESVRRHESKSQPGFVIKSGTYIDLTENILLDVFLDYYYQKMNFHSKRKAELGGFKTGIGLGYRF